MPKMKTHRGAAKRLKRTGSGKLKRAKAYKSHILTKKSPKTKAYFLRTQYWVLYIFKVSLILGCEYALCRKMSSYKAHLI